MSKQWTYAELCQICGDFRELKGFATRLRAEDDVARALILGYQSEVHGTAINIGSGQAHSVKQVADLISPKQEHVAARKNDLLGTLADTCRARRLLNFRARHDFIDTMKVGHMPI